MNHGMAWKEAYDIPFFVGRHFVSLEGGILFSALFCDGEEVGDGNGDG